MAAKKKKVDTQLIFEEYKLFVATAEKNSDRRQIANSFFLTFHSLLLTGTGYLTTISEDSWLIILSFLGIISSYLWVMKINSFRQLNSGKFKVIHELEEYLPYQLFKKEWDYLGQGEDRKKYKKLTVVETGVPYIFMLMYAFFILTRVIPYLCAFLSKLC
ncbi:hypothetical protein ACFL3V_03695 [Nanoarchaeota archaeon]